MKTQVVKSIIQKELKQNGICVIQADIEILEKIEKDNKTLSLCTFKLKKENRSELLAQLLQSGLFQSGDLRLGDTDLGGNLHLGLIAVIAEIDDGLLPLRKRFDRLAQGDVLQP